MPITMASVSALMPWACIHGRVPSQIDRPAMAAVSNRPGRSLGIGRVRPCVAVFITPGYQKMAHPDPGDINCKTDSIRIFNLFYG
ncbi:hypothetical protein D3C81_1681780 [compost metagenome]